MTLALMGSFDVAKKLTWIDFVSCTRNSQHSHHSGLDCVW